jgi:hypothetical protein
MKKSRLSEEQVVAVLQGSKSWYKTTDLCRK